MDIKPDIQTTKGQSGKTNYYIGFKASLTFDEFFKFVKKYILRKKDFDIKPPKTNDQNQ